MINEVKWSAVVDYQWKRKVSVVWGKINMSWLDTNLFWSRIKWCLNMISSKPLLTVLLFMKDLWLWCNHLGCNLALNLSHLLIMHNVSVCLSCKCQNWEIGLCRQGFKLEFQRKCFNKKAFVVKTKLIELI